MKKILTLLFLFSSLPLCAEDINALMIHFKSGKTMTLLLDEQPVTTFSGEDIVITTHMNQMTYNGADVQKYTYLYVDPTAVKSVSTGSLFTIKDNTISLNGLAAGAELSIYSADGILLSSSKTDSHGNATLNLPHQAGKVYVVKTPIANFKICKP